MPQLWLALGTPSSTVWWHISRISGPGGFFVEEFLKRGFNLQVY